MDDHWCHMDESKCPCGGQGWAEVDNGTWKECPVHFEGQLHPETRVLLLDEPAHLAEEERKSRLNYQIKTTREQIKELQGALKNQQQHLVALELELINRTATVKGMPAIRPEDMMHAPE
jgi:hypothetical protein